MPQGTTSSAALPQMKPAALRTFHAALHAWYKTHGRHDLPWRQTDDPYRIWLSEVMLQQTQVATVRDRFYHPFLEKFPTVEALAAAPREAVMKAWEGLGYYRRAGFLHEAAKCSRGGMPSDIAGLLALPGIGKNTAHAIAAFAYHQPVAILEANVKRVVARIFALEAASDTQLWQGADALLNHSNPFDYNQAMMDLGSMVCTPKAPGCNACPAHHICKGQTAPQHYPMPKAKKTVPTRTVVILVRIDANGHMQLQARDAKLLGGLYGFEQREAPPKGAMPLGNVEHVYSHFKLASTVYVERVPTRMNGWYSRAEIAALPLSTLDHKVLALVENSHTAQKNAAKGKPAKRAR